HPPQRKGSAAPIDAVGGVMVIVVPSRRVRYRFVASGPTIGNSSPISSPTLLRNSPSRPSGNPNIHGSPQSTNVFWETRMLRSPSGAFSGEARCETTQSMKDLLCPSSTIELLGADWVATNRSVLLTASSGMYT